MELYPASPIVITLLLVCMARGPRWILMFIAFTLPFGMFAALSLPSVGGLSILAVNLSAAALLGIAGLILLAKFSQRIPIAITPAALALIIFTLYAIFSATVLVRLFSGEIMVFPLARGDTGTRVSVLFSWGKSWLAPSSSNISQTFYIVLACGFFISACHVLKKHGPQLGVKCMVIAASTNLVLGLLDLASLDEILSFVRTANYSLSNEASVNGIPRIIGGYSEAASFGSACSIFYAYFGSSFLHSGKWKDGLLALGNCLFAVLALSSTGLIAVSVVTLVLFYRLYRALPQRFSPNQIIGLAITLSAISLGVGAAMIFTDILDIFTRVVEDLILNKSQTSSGLERKAWALGGLQTFTATWGLGAGTGSIRSNGIVFVLLGSVGLPGTLAFVAFLWFAFSGYATSEHKATLSNSRMAALAALTTMMLTATVPDPGVPLILLAAIAVSARAHSPQTHRQTVIQTAHI